MQRFVSDFSQPTKGEREVQLVRGQDVVEPLDERMIWFSEAIKTEFGRQPVLMMGMKSGGVLIDDLLCRVFRGLLVIVNQWQKALRENRQIPVHDAGLVGPGVTSVPIDGTKAGLRIEMVHESTGAVIDGLST